jgi:hypothetical protein
MSESKSVSEKFGENGNPTPQIEFGSKISDGPKSLRLCTFTNGNLRRHFSSEFGRTFSRFSAKLPKL